MKVYLILCAIAVTTIFSSCPKKADPCGQFTFDGHHFVSDFGEELPGVEMSLEFQFDPSLCGSSNCQCDQVVFIQLIRILDVPNQKFLTLDPEQEKRMVKSGTAAGWWIDRTPGATRGFFKQYNEGHFLPEIIIGSNTVTARMTDAPIKQKAKWQFWEFIDVPVCISGGCVNKVLGYYTWSFVIDKEGKVSDQSILHGQRSDYFDHLTAAVAAWNDVAVAEGKVPLPQFSQLRDP